MSKIYGQFPKEWVREAETDERGLVRVKQRRLEGGNAPVESQLKAEPGDMERRRLERKERGLITVDKEMLRISKDALDAEVWSVEGGEVDRPFLDHPEVVSLMQTYGAYFESGEIVFPEVLPAGKTRRLGTSRTAAVTTVSPMAGQKSYRDRSLIVRKVVLRQGEDVYAEFSDNGLIFGALPYGAPPVTAPDGHKWRCFASAIELARPTSADARSARNEAIAEVTIEYRSGYYPEEIYRPWYA